MFKRLHNLFKVQISTNSNKRRRNSPKPEYSKWSSMHMNKHFLLIHFWWNSYQTAAYFIFVSLYVSTFQSKRTTAFVHVKYSWIVNYIFFQHVLYQSCYIRLLSILCQSVNTVLFMSSVQTGCFNFLHDFLVWKQIKMLFDHV